MFAVIGGSVLAFKSLAATVWFTAYPPNGVKCSGNCSLVWDGHVKYPLNAARVNDTANSSRAYADIYLGHPWTAYPSYTMVPTKVCASLRSTNNTVQSTATIGFDLDGRANYNFTTFNIPSDLNYREYCTPFTGVPGGSHTVRAWIAKSSVNNADVYVSAISVQTP